jgi:hypothetical protein
MSIQRGKPTLACGRAGEFAKNNLQRIEKPNGLEQLGSSIRWKKLALFIKILAVKNLSESRSSKCHSGGILLYSFRYKITVIARRFLPKQSLGFQRIASLRNARNDITNQPEMSIQLEVMSKISKRFLRNDSVH